MPLPIAHGLVGASVAAALRPSHQSRGWKTLLVAAFPHSIPFAFLVGLVMVIVSRDWKSRSFLVFGAAFASHTLLDFLFTESQGVALWWPLTNHRYKLRLPNPVDYTSLWDTPLDVLKISLSELVIFAPLLLTVILLRRVLRRSRLRRAEQAVGAD